MLGAGSVVGAAWHTASCATWHAADEGVVEIKIVPLAGMSNSQVDFCTKYELRGYRLANTVHL